MDKVKYLFKIYQNYVKGSFLHNSMIGTTTRFANDMFEQKRTMIWENMLIGTESTQRKTCNMMHNGRWHERICNFCATQEKSLFGNNFLVKNDRQGMEFRRKTGTNFPGTDKPLRICKKKKITIK
ncbi:hypothetical protein ACS0TY_034559 [Phlomoides rotata]